MRRHKNAGENYIQKYPHLQKWIVQCVKCQTRGYSASMPRLVGRGSGGASHIRKHFHILTLNSFGLCEMCGEPDRELE